MEPGFTTSVFDYTVFVAKDADRFEVKAEIHGRGTIGVMREEDQEIGTEFDYLDDEPKVMILTVEREYMDVAEYRVTVIREETVPTARGVEISVTPGIGAFFLGRGVLPEFRVTAKPPSVGGVLSYQWYVNTENSNRGGTRINGATGTTYKMKSYETMITGTFYYYAEVTNTIDGKTGITESNPCRVTFVDKNDLTDKSRAQDYMANIPAGEVTTSKINNNPQYWYYDNNFPWDASLPWDTPGFSMGKYLVTYELWKYVFDHADATNYRFSNSGNQGAEGPQQPSMGDGTVNKPLPVGNALHPVTMISWRDAVVWCNAYSEMDGREPVYVDTDGNVLRNSRSAVELLVDETKMTGNGYRLPTKEEWAYAARGANPSTSPPWSDQYPGTNEDGDYGDYNVLSKYLWSCTDTAMDNLVTRTTEVGTLLPNSIGLYDMMGMVVQWTGHYDGVVGLSYQQRAYTNLFSASLRVTNAGSNMINGTSYNSLVHVGLRLARNKE